MDLRDKQPYGVPFRCLYSASVENLLMAGKHISVTHVASSSVKFMGIGLVGKLSGHEHDASGRFVATAV